MLRKQRSLADETCQRRPQLVRDVRGEAPLAGLRLVQRLDLLLQRRRHLVERLGPGAELVAPLDREPCLQEPFRERVRGDARLRDRAKRPPREQRADESREQHHDPEPGEQDVAEDD